MYLHHLELRAIGPYPDLVSIDFAALAASGVFLLEGPTGSGKSTIIDAVVFALYGGLAGSDASSDRLHSQHADPAVEPFVELVFETGAGVFRVRRTPQYDRPKQRGTGTVRQQSSAQLVRLPHPTDPAGEPISARAQEVGAEIARIVGLDRAQFLQTVVLPQGEFARFLKSPGEERRKLLQSLFGTEIYDRTADELAARRRAAAAEVESADARVRDALARFAEASGRTTLDLPGVDESEVPAIVLELRRIADAAVTARTAAAAAARAAVEHEQSVVQRRTALDRRSALLARSAALDERADAVAESRARLSLAERAARVVAVADGLDAARARADTVAEELAALRLQHDVTADDTAGERDRLSELVGAVRHLVPVALALPERRRAVDDARAQAERLGTRLAELDAALEARPAERARIVEASRAAAETAADAETARHEADVVRDLRRLVVDLAAARTRVQAAETSVASARSAAQDALVAEQHLRERRIAGLAGELGQALQPGDACPVCGSVEHPAVATPQDDHPTPAQIAEAAATARRADDALATAATTLAVERAEQERLTAAVGSIEPEELDRRAAVADERVRAARTAATTVAERERDRAAHDDVTRALEQDRNDVDARRQVLLATTANDSDRVEQDTTAVVDALATLAGHLDVEPKGLPEAVSAVDDRIQALRAVAEAVERVRIATAAVAERATEVTAAVRAQDFADVAAARAAVLGADDAERLRTIVDDADRERAVVDAGLAEPAVVQAADDDPATIDLDAAGAETSRTAQVLDEATRTAATTGERADASERCAGDFERAVCARESTSARSRAVVRLADIAAGVPGQNPTGITLGTYVLMRRFEDVVAAANDRLRTMLGGRFTLETSDERESGARARRTGLALAVRDHTTDTTRDPRSLSGGETFTFSLCLALGLADVVQAEAGGVALGTLFVDEGFGTLDPETLDGVIGQLSKLTAGGRQVGIVSHVEELKQRIPERIAVRRAPGGGSQVSTTV
ncbi:exonuclease SbcC [Curtobacterium sp. 9128]|uniref:AAA family ATPase n=1 Tax=Curtobacterium sp. 9128 TaxID=1793722 RepID=UPI0007D71982|nr:SMC family ATPase [Curtobacterium sp. 9128]SBN62341.1 exonuclease SbcC [Curtobacterium sp. 9128]